MVGLVSGAVAAILAVAAAASAQLRVAQQGAGFPVIWPKTKIYNKSTIAFIKISFCTQLIYISYCYFTIDISMVGF